MVLTVVLTVVLTRGEMRSDAERVSFAAAHPDEVETTINNNQAAAERAERAARERERFLAS